MKATGPAAERNLQNRLSKIGQGALEAELDDCGYATVPGLLNARDCRDLVGLYASETRFRRHVDMSRHGYGRGEYKYFSYPLPPIVAVLREGLYPKLAPIANHWNQRMGLDARFPDDHETYLDQCHAAGQTRPTPLLLRYGAGDYNRLHQDVYGALLFPLQMTVLLSEPDRDFTGGEFILTEQRPRMQSRAEIVRLKRGDAVIFPVRTRPVHGTRRDFRVTMRHGVSRLLSGARHTLGIIFHDAT
jgi:hypothetical protein